LPILLILEEITLSIKNGMELRLEEERISQVELEPIFNGL
jgi:hypothetical protein